MKAVKKYMERQFYTEEEVSALTAIPRKTLQHYRAIGEGPPWIRFGTRSIRYPIDDFEKWVDENLHLALTSPVNE